MEQSTDTGAAEQCRALLEPALCAALRSAEGTEDGAAVPGGLAAAPAPSVLSTQAAAHVTACLLSGAASMLSLPQPASADAATPTTAVEAPQGSKKKRKHSQRNAAAPITCGSRMKHDLQTAVSRLFSACRPPLLIPPQNVEPTAEQSPALDDLLRIYRADSTTADGDVSSGVNLPRDVLVRLIRYLEAVATYSASSSRDQPLQIGSAAAAGPDSPLTQRQSGEHAGVLS